MKKMVLALLPLLVLGCGTPFFKSVQGTSTSIGITIPNEEVLELEALHYLNGEKVVVREPACIHYKFSASETNSYLGIVHTQSCRESDLTVSLTNALWKAEGRTADE